MLRLAPWGPAFRPFIISVDWPANWTWHGGVHWRGCGLGIGAYRGRHCGQRQQRDASACLGTWRGSRRARRCRLPGLRQARRGARAVRPTRELGWGTSRVQRGQPLLHLFTEAMDKAVDSGHHAPPAMAHPVLLKLQAARSSGFSLSRHHPLGPSALARGL